MADTQRTIAGLKTILPDNTSGDISPQDLRDFVESIRTGHAEISLSSSALTNIATQSVYQNIEGTTVLSTTPAAVDWSMPANTRLRYDGVATRLVKVSCNLCVTSAGANKSFRFRLAKNGTTQADTEARQFLAVASQEENVSMTGIFEVVTNDYIEAFVSNETDTTDITAVNLSIDVISFAV